MAEHSTIECPQCNGTGAARPECWCCHGELVIEVEKALAEGFSFDDLDDVDDGKCPCPADDCRGSTCDLCEGCGWITEDQRETEITRVLICGLTQHIPPQLIRLPYGRVAWHEEYLFSFAGNECRERRWVTWYESILGDELSLTPAGEKEARCRLWAWHRRRDVSLAPIDDFGRLDDDGAPPRRERDHG